MYLRFVLHYNKVIQNKKSCYIYILFKILKFLKKLIFYTKIIIISNKKYWKKNKSFNFIYI